MNGTLRDDHSFNRSSDREVRHLVQATVHVNIQFQLARFAIPANFT